MANIQKVLGRHKWREQRIPQLRTGFKDDPDRMKLLCLNCRQPHDPEVQGDPPVTGCISDIDCMRLGDSRMRDLARQEDRLRHAAIRAERQREAEADQKLQEYLQDYARRHG